jgi:hypothetical protein
MVTAHRSQGKTVDYVGVSLAPGRIVDELAAIKCGM